MRILRQTCAAAAAGAMLAAVAAQAAQSSVTPLDGRPPLTPGRDDREPLPDPEIRPVQLGTVELGARPDVIIREIRF
ncbi:MAG: hypothetical protein KIT23_09670, partial [Sphingopyxis sp.]|nr:hypothetical protein [Sphingopyxis sp.]